MSASATQGDHNEVAGREISVEILWQGCWPETDEVWIPILSVKK